MGIKTYQEKNGNAMEKELAQSDIPVKRKIQKTIRNTIFQESGIFGWLYILKAKNVVNYAFALTNCIKHA